MYRAGFCLSAIVLSIVCSGGVADAQLRFRADYLLWNRNNDSNSSIITGTGGVSAGDTSFGYASGYQFTLGGSSNIFDVEASFMSIPTGWSSSAGGTLTQPLVFDDPANAFVAPANGLGFVSALGVAAQTPGVEDNEIEFLEAGAQYQTHYTSQFNSFELNLGSSRTVRPVFFSLGWRHMELKESAAVLVRGNFQVRDSATGTFPGGGGNLPNDQLSNAALIAAGFTNTSGAADGFSGYDPTAVAPVITQMGISYKGAAFNDLDGMQLTVGGRYPVNDMFTMQGTLKGGVYQNYIRASVHESVFGIVNDDSVYERTFRDSTKTASFAGAIGLDAILALTDYVNFTLGYQALFVTNMAFANAQTGGISTDLFGAAHYNLVSNGLLLAHGVNVGLEFWW
ncbi:MAG: hypothetical protein U0992_15305 [Planctomycetaceae bacterium]